MNDTGENSHGPIKLNKERLAPSRHGGSSAVLWATRGALAGLGLASGWFAYSVFRPLPAANVSFVDPAPAFAVIPETGVALPDRTSRLLALSRENFFAPDHALWAAQIVDDTEDHQTQVVLDDLEDSGKPYPSALIKALHRGDSAPYVFEDIEVTGNADVSPAILRALKDVRLRGVARMAHEVYAMIGIAGDETWPQSHVVAAGDTLGIENEWSVLAIDDFNDRIFLTRDDRNFEFRLYPDRPLRARPEGADADSIAAAATDGEGGIRVERQSLEDLRRALAAEGITGEEIDELTDLMNEIDLEEVARGPAPAVVTDEVAADQSDSDASQAIAATKEKGPAGIEAILQLLSSNPFGEEEDDSAGDDGAGNESDAAGDDS